MGVAVGVTVGVGDGPGVAVVVVEPVVARLSALGFPFARAKHMRNNHNEIEVFAYKT